MVSYADKKRVIPRILLVEVLIERPVGLDPRFPGLDGTMNLLVRGQRRKS
jgi:hypothetical protein